MSHMSEILLRSSCTALRGLLLDGGSYHTVTPSRLRSACDVQGDDAHNGEERAVRYDDESCLATTLYFTISH